MLLCRVTSTVYFAHCRIGWPAPTWGTNARSPRERITHSFKRFTAQQCNAYLGAQGRFWQQESYDHWARDPDELLRIMQYVEWNPVKAGLVAKPEDWQFSSAHDRKIARIELGAPLPRA